MYIFFGITSNLHIYIHTHYLTLPTSRCLAEQLQLALTAVVVVLLLFIGRLCDDKDSKLTELLQAISTRQVLMRQLVIPPEERHSSQGSGTNNSLLNPGWIEELLIILHLLLIYGV